MIVPGLMIYCGYRGLTAGLDAHNYAEGTYVLLIGYLLFVILREARRADRVKYREARKQSQSPDLSEKVQQRTAGHYSFLVAEKQTSELLSVDGDYLVDSRIRGH